MIHTTKKYRHTKKTRECLRAHINGYFTDRPIQVITYETGSLRKMFPNCHVLEIAPSNENDFWVYATQGAWEVAKNEVYETGRYGFEFMILSAQKNLLHVKTLEMVTFYHASPQYRLMQGSVVEIGGSWIEGSLCDHFLVSLPYALPYEFETLIVEDLYLSFRWLLPITEKEAQFANVNGSDALEQKFEDNGCEFLDTNRKSLIN